MAASVGGTLVVVAALVVLVASFVVQSLPAWRHSGVGGYLTGTRWFYRHELFGAAPMIFGTCAVAVVALATAAPVGIGAAVCTAEFLPRGARLAIKSVVELLAGIPSVVYGLLGILVLREKVYALLRPFDPLSGDTLLTAGLLLSVMILPTLMTLSDDALRGVPASQRAAARALGLNASEVVLRISLPQAAPGLLAAVLLSLGRALGEMIAVFLVVGRRDNQWPGSLADVPRLVAESGQTLASKLGSSEINIAYGDPLHWGAMVALGLVLLAMVGVLTVASSGLLRRTRTDPNRRPAR